MSGFIVTEKAMRPASKERRCFYCHQEISAEHADDCALINRKVRVKMTAEYEIEVPAHWDKEMIEFQRNDSSWCVSNAINELEELFGRDDGPCMCDIARFEFVGETNGVKYLDE